MIPEKEYQKIIKSMPIFCVDFLFKCGDKHLLIKRNEEPCKGLYWVVGGRLFHKEKIHELAERVHKREVGKYYSNFKIIGISNYIFPDVPNSRATHTPTLLTEVIVDEMFTPKIDNTHSDFIWTTELPQQLKEQTVFFYD